MKQMQNRKKQKKNPNLSLVNLSKHDERKSFSSIKIDVTKRKINIIYLVFSDL